MSMNKIRLDDEIVDIIQEVSNKIKEESGLPDIVKNTIFDILEQKCTVIYYPLKNEKNRGFHIRKLVNDKLEDFVYINTEKTAEQQIFTAAHELGHIYNVYAMVVEKGFQRGIKLDINNQDYEEKVTDRFAAELLMPEVEFKELTMLYSKELGLSKEVSVVEMLKLIAKLMNQFMSPFDAVRKRLREIKVIDDTADAFLSKNKVEYGSVIEFLKRDENSLINIKTDIKTISGLREFIEEADRRPDIDKTLIKKIKSEFSLEDIELNDGINISLSGVTID